MIDSLTNVTAEKVAEDLRALGIRENGTLLVHSSLRSLGPVEGGAETVIQGLLLALGHDGTLLFPALSFASVGKDSPRFDVRETPSCVGALTEYFRTRDGTLRSMHPTHSVSGAGFRAAELLGSHQQDSTPCGPNSPFHKLPEVEGQVLFLGCGLRPNTSMHAIEERVEPPYLFGDPITYTMIDHAGNESQMVVRSHYFRGWEQRYDRLANVMDDGLSEGKVLNADCHLVESTAMWEAALKRLKSDPMYFVDQVADEA